MIINKSDHLKNSFLATNILRDYHRRYLRGLFNTVAVVTMDYYKDIQKKKEGEKIEG